MKKDFNPAPAGEQHSSRHDLAKYMYRGLFTECERSAQFLADEIARFLVLLEEAAEAREKAWGNDGGADEIACMTAPVGFRFKLSQLMRLLAAMRS